MLIFSSRNPLLIVDREHRIICAFLGTPEDPDWPSVVARAGEALKQAREDGLSVGAFAAADKCHRRGKFFSLAGGLSHGGGQKKPGMIVLSRHQRRLFQNLLKNKDIRRICGFQSSGFRTFGPKMFKQYVLALKPLFEHLPELEHIFTNSVYPAITFNLGPDSVTFEHLDFNNNPFGWCGITSAGDFDAKRGAHIHLKQLKLVVEFPSGASTLIPSAVVDHGNTPLGSGETRYSITQYAAGGLFRFVQYGMKTAKELMAQEGGASMKSMVDGAPGERAQWGVDLFSKEDELAADHAAMFRDM
ncbi:hypothetical protein B0H15DRAFT_792336 [Mycena belliarum]|uniref:Uncharacterized protein n=1 Tax=Mycena belliarum TaxID=1033014 RepID=A0AAD6XM40_9AGAR|nr:hypothetical protein B0H15DRAFT_792336 [Mycena belliae]